jgi:putative tryptophan/tyrosine transport system substrate-binding protein
MRLSRRWFVQSAGVAGLGLLAGCGRMPWQGAEPRKVYRIGVLFASLSPSSSEAEAFRAGLHDYGYTDGKNVVIEYRLAEGRQDRLPSLAAELVTLPVDLILTAGYAAVRAAKGATSTIPIVMANTAPGDPVGNGLVDSITRPSGNVTGLSTYSSYLAGKRLQLLTEAVSHVSRLAVLVELGGPVGLINELQDAARELAVELNPVVLHGPDDVEAAFEAATAEGADAMLVSTGSVVRADPARVADLAFKSHLPAIYDLRTYVDAGGLMSYGASTTSTYRRAAYYVDRISKGAKAADLPIEQPREFDFVINLKTAQALGLTIPQHVLLQATEVIQ